MDDRDHSQASDRSFRSPSGQSDYWSDRGTRTGDRRARLPRKPHADSDSQRGAGQRGPRVTSEGRYAPPPDNRFPPTMEHALRRMEKVRPNAYAKTRNFVDGAVTRLSPYLTHGFLTIPQCIAQISLRHPLTLEDKLIYEFAWREYFHHVWSRLNDGILSDIRGPVWRGRYATALPEDIREGATGVAVIDLAVRSLYKHGYLHNHIRMWLASYIVHIRKVDWKAGAAWMYAHLLDGDLASNNLSWQWVAGTFAHKPYLFNAENVARYCSNLDCSGTAIDTSYVDLESIARGRNDVGPETGHHERVGEPDVVNDVMALLNQRGFEILDDSAFESRMDKSDIELRHPWDLSEAGNQGRPLVAWLDLDFHDKFAWTERRWDFVLSRLRELSAQIWVTRSRSFVKHAAHLHGLYYTDTLNPGYTALRDHANAHVRPAPRFFANPLQLQPSFTRFFDQAMAGRELSIEVPSDSRYSA